jgi:hypothetical protein
MARLSFFTALLLAQIVLSGTSFAQDPNDYGIPDTVRIQCPVIVDPIVPGDSFKVGIYVWNDEDVLGWSVSLVYSSDYIEVTSMDSTGGVFGFLQWATGMQFVPSPESNQWVVGWYDPNPAAIPPIPPETLSTGELADTARLWLSLNFRVLPGATAQTINIDTLFLAPGGYFALSQDTSYGGFPYNVVNTAPIYSDCGTEEIVLGQQSWLSLVTPDRGRLGEQLWVSMTGTNTSFAVGSGVATEAWLHLSQSGDDVFSDQVNVNSPTDLDALFQIPNDATVGLYDVYTQVTGQTPAFIHDAFEIYVDCGDIDHSGSVNISDVVYLVGYIFGAQPTPNPEDVANTDCSATVNLSDAVYIIAYIFGSGNAPCDPSGDGMPDCGP